jgi:site-specific DNA-methyltransferase (adenine-specific)
MFVEPVASAREARMSKRTRSTRRATSTSSFGVGARESHDATPFYRRFQPPVLSDDDAVPAPRPVAEPFVHGDARQMDAVTDRSVALVVTSPPYFAGKQYEQELERDGVPSSYLEYLALLEAVFAECVRTLEPGGRIAVNVANLGRKPYRSLSADVIRIFEDLGLLLRGEIIWQKGEGANGSCAWGSYRRAANPVLRDVTERVVVASKGRFDRARSARRRAADGLPHRSTLPPEDFMALTLDVWSIPPESARRVGHPAPFPVELPEQLIRLYTYEDDLVLDPFMGSGSALVAAARLGRRYVGYDTDAGYVEIARRRVEDAVRRRSTDPVPLDEGRTAVQLAEAALDDAGFTIEARDQRIAKTGVAVSFVATDAAGATWLFDVAGGLASHRRGLLRNDAVWRALGRACALQRARAGAPLVLLTSAVPRRPGEGDTALRAAGPATVFDVVDVLADEARERLRHYAKGGATDRPVAGFWTETDLRASPSA